jgi:D-arabinose 1-dehydrogenase-like Zn-dependent alcohol dehydrogenase
MTAQMKAVAVSKAKGKWELQDKDRPEVGPGQALVRIRACGICG